MTEEMGLQMNVVDRRRLAAVIKNGDISSSVCFAR